ncbi:tetratricopeptide repeat protein, partial [Chloroflexota bacterium]
FLVVGIWILVAGAISIPGLKPIGQETFQGATRLELVQGGLDLAGDFPITGGGLETFPGLYSHYIMETPFFLIPFAHNIFIDAAIEQGVLGVLAMGWVLFGSIWLLAKRLGTESESPFGLAILGCLLVMITHNMVDNLVYYTLSAPLLFILPGFAVAVARAGDPQDDPSRVGGAGRWRFAALGALVLVILLAGAWFRQPLAATWYAGLGAVQMSKTQLADFPSGKWDAGGDMERFAAADALFLTALAYDPENRTANHRLGLIAMLDHDFQRAVPHLEIALQADPEHRGIRKALGYSYTWNGQYVQASELLTDLPEVIQEMDVYTWWWGTLGRDDLAGNAQEMLALLASIGTLP